MTVMMMSSKSVEWLQDELESGAGALLLLDCRPHELYESSHIESAINLAIPGLMLRRLKKGNLPIRSIIPNNEDKEKFVKRCKTDVVLLYDEATSERHESGLGSSVMGLLLQKLRDDGCKAFYLEGKRFIYTYSVRFEVITCHFKHTWYQLVPEQSYNIC